MKIRNTSFIIVMTAMLSACGISHTYISTMRQPDVEVSGDVHRIVTVDRSLPARKEMSIIEGIATGEHIGQDDFARKSIFESLRAIMSSQERFELVSSGMRMEGSNSGTTMPEPMRERSLIGIAKKYEADAVLALEMLDSDTRSGATRIIAREARIRTGIDPINYPNNLRTGWRLYDGKNGQIIDEFQTYITEEGWWAYADRPSHLDRRRVVEGADVSAYQMAGRIIPIEVLFDRMYFKNSGLSNRSLKQASDYVKAERFDQAGRIWLDLFHSDAGKKARGRAAFNMALWNEERGDVDEALEWIDRSIELGNRKAIKYGVVLDERQRQPLLD